MSVAFGFSVLLVAGVAIIGVLLSVLLVLLLVRAGTSRARA
jgi:hypothetical protein